MIKVHYSQTDHWLSVELCQEITVSDIQHAATRIRPILHKMRQGYTLIEVFKGKSHMDQNGSALIGTLAQACYQTCRIWRVVRVRANQANDPGLIITHRTRWARAVPEIDVDDFPSALALAREERKENVEWIQAACQ
jgi:hypothetical protein